MSTIAGIVVRLLVAIGLGLSSLVLLGAGPAQACTCVQMNAAASAERADQVFVGTVEGRATGDGMPQEVRYTVAVDAVYKGDAAGRVEVTTPGNPGSCGLPTLPTGEPVIWFASERNLAGGRPDEEGTDGEARLFVNSCDGTAAATPALESAVADALGAPGAPTEAVPDETAGPSGAGSADPAQNREEGQDAEGAAVRDDGTAVWPWALATGVAVAGAAAYVARRRAG